MASPANDTGKDQPHNHKNSSSSHEKSKVLFLGGLCRGGVLKFLLLRSLRHVVEMQIESSGVFPHLICQLHRTCELVLHFVVSNQNIFCIARLGSAKINPPGVLGRFIYDLMTHLPIAYSANAMSEAILQPREPTDIRIIVRKNSTLWAYVCIIQ